MAVLGGHRVADQLALAPGQARRKRGGGTDPPWRLSSQNAVRSLLTLGVLCGFLLTFR